MATEKVTYWAESILVSKVFWVNLISVILEILDMTGLVDVFPPGFVQYRVMLVGILNIILRKFTVRPVALISPGATAPVTVAKLR
jgi:hypothetical protein